MIIPSGIIMPLFLITFVLVCYQYYRIDPKRRVLNLRFGVMAAATAGAVSFPCVSYIYGSSPLLAQLSQYYLLAGVLCLASGFILLRRMPPVDQH